MSPMVVVMAAVVVGVQLPHPKPQQFAQSRGVARAAGGSCRGTDALGEKEPRKAFALPGEGEAAGLPTESPARPCPQPTFLGSVDVGA